MHHHLGTGGQSRSLQQNLETGQEDPAVITDALRLPANPATNSSRKLVLTSSTQRKEEKKPAQSRGTLKGTGAAEQDVSGYSAGPHSPHGSRQRAWRRSLLLRWNFIPKMECNRQCGGLWCDAGGKFRPRARGRAIWAWAGHFWADAW